MMQKLALIRLTVSEVTRFTDGRPRHGITSDKSSRAKNGVEILLPFHKIHEIWRNSLGGF